LQRAWCVAPEGNPAEVVRYMEEFVDLVERDPRALVPPTADRIHCGVLIGIPGIVDTFERFARAFQQVRGDTPAPWHMSALVVAAWANLWRGRRAEALACIEETERLQHRFGAVRLAIERLGQLKTVADVALGRHAAAVSLMKRHIEGMQSAELAGHGTVWLRPYRQGLSRANWVAGDADGFREVLPYLLAPQGPGEWPFVEHMIWIARGQAATFDGHWDLAEDAYREAMKTYGRLRMPMLHTDARIGLAHALLQQGRRADAWETFRPAYEEVIAERAIGLFLLDSRAALTALLEILPADVRRSPNHVALMAEWSTWNEACTVEGPIKAGALSSLSEREYEVLAAVAAGASNKHIARQLSLSLHTVKRHIANILDKLDCDSRGQAADLFRRSGERLAS
jgi:LuxR family maltose regulon positive regulatory protein